MVDTHIAYNVRLIREDMADRGWMIRDLARAAGVSGETVRLFLIGQTQTPKTAKKIADAFGKTVRRYRISSEAAA